MTLFGQHLIKLGCFLFYHVVTLDMRVPLLNVATFPIPLSWNIFGLLFFTVFN